MAASLADLAERARAAVVHVRGETTEGPAADADSETGRTSIGTGFIINKDGYLVTNEHVIRGVIDLRVRLYDGRELPACVVGADAATDIALIKVDDQAAAAGAAARRLGRRARRRAGDRHRQPLRLQPQRDRGHRLGEGARRRSRQRCTSRRRRISIRSSSRPTRRSTSATRAGRSSTPTGAVIGVNAAFWAGHPLQPAQGIGFAIPINMAKSLLPRLARDGDARRAYLGVDAQPSIRRSRWR